MWLQVYIIARTTGKIWQMYCAVIKLAHKVDVA